MKGHIGRRPLTPAESATQVKRERDRESRLRRKLAIGKPRRTIDGEAWLAGEPSPLAGLVDLARVADRLRYRVNPEEMRRFAREERLRCRSVREMLAGVRERARERQGAGA